MLYCDCLEFIIVRVEETERKETCLGSGDII